MSSPPVFSAGDRPASIIDGAGRWLADQLGPSYQWLPRPRLVQAVSGSLTVSFVLQASSRNRTSESTTVTVKLIVEDGDLRRWQQDHHSLCHQVDGTVIAIYLDNLVASPVTVQLYGQLHRVEPMILSLPDLVQVLHTKILPALPHLDSPAQAVRGLPDQWWVEPHGLVEWAVSRGDPDSARQMIQRYLRRNPARVHAFQQGLSNPEPPADPLYNPDTTLGRLAATTGLIHADEQLPMRTPTRRRTLLQRLRGDH